jgi:hypothetical protein
MRNNSVAASCIQATLFEKIDEMEFPPLSGHILIRGFTGVACLSVQFGSSGASGGYDHESAAIGEGAGAGRSSRGLRYRLGC